MASFIVTDVDVHIIHTGDDAETAAQMFGVYIGKYVNAMPPAPSRIIRVEQITLRGIDSIIGKVDGKIVAGIAGMDFETWSEFAPPGHLSH